ncbi:MAG: TolC family protein [Myxococcaceae bacterium]
MNALLLSAVLAATPITLEQVREESRNNLQALLAELDRVRASEGKRVATAPLLPQLGVYSSSSRTWTQAGDPRVGNNGEIILGTSGAQNYFTLGATLNQLIFDLGRFAALANAGDLERAAKGAVAEQILASEFEAVRRFYALWTAQKQLLVLEATAARSKEFSDRAQALFEAGRGNKGDALAAQVNLGNDRISAEKQRAVVSQAQIDLASWLGRPEIHDLDAVDPALPETPAAARVTLPQGLELARTNRPLLVQYAAQVKAAEANVTTQAAGWAPRLQATVQYSRAADTASKVYGNFDKYGAVTAGLNLNWDLFSGFQTDAQVKQAKAQVAQAKLNLAQNERDVEGQVKVALDSYGAQLRSLELAQQNRVTATQNLEYAQERFKAGASSTLDVRDAQVKLAQAYQTLIQTRSDTEVARAALDKAMGTLSNGATP